MKYYKFNEIIEKKNQSERIFVLVWTVVTK